MNTIVREMNPAGEIELTDAQLTAVYGACDDEEWQLRCEPECEEVRPRCHREKHHHSSTTIIKKVVFFKEDFFFKKDDDSCFCNTW